MAAMLHKDIRGVVLAGGEYGKISVSDLRPDWALDRKVH
jgi:hypothetical protein